MQARRFSQPLWILPLMGLFAATWANAKPTPWSDPAARLFAAMWANRSEASAQTATDPFAECEERFAEDPRSRQAAQCFFDVAHAKGSRWSEAARRLRRHRAGHPDQPWVHLYLGHALLYQFSEQAEASYREAVGIFERRGEAAEEIQARLDLIRCLLFFKQFEEAGRVLERAVAAAEALEEEEPLLLAAVRIRQAFQYLKEVKHLDYAYHLLRQVEADIFAKGTRQLREQWLQATAFVCDALGRREESRGNLKRWLAIALEAGNLTSEAQARIEIAIDQINNRLPSPEARQEARDLFAAALSAANAAAHRWIESRAHIELGKLTGGAGGRRHLDQGLDIASELGDPELLTKVWGALATSWLDEDPDKARSWIERVLTAALDAEADPWLSIYGWEERLTVHWATLPRHEAAELSLALLDRIESLRELQSSEAGQAGVISFWSNPYYWISGRLLNSGEAADQQLAFQVIERMRAQVLHQALESADAVPAPESASEPIRQLSEVLDLKVGIQRRLLNPRLDAPARADALAELRSVESQEAQIRHLVATAAPAYAFLRKPPLASLEDLESSLGDDEAVLSYQIGLDEDFFGRFGGQAWLTVSTREGTRSYRLPDRVVLEPAIRMLSDVADLDAAPAAFARLYDDLLGPALAELPRGVKRLVIVPDGRLHLTPFALLRPTPDDEPLIAGYRLSLAPSATLWLRWRRLDPPASATPALVLADPAVVGQTAAAAASRAVRQWAFEEGSPLERLPYARKEGEAVVRALGGESRLLVGEEASERFLKESDLRRYGVIHFAAHAVINDEVPERSAVLLAPGADDEDGWLQAQDVVGLDLDGRVVVLASCSGAGGQVLRGEGPMSLARAFFQAGAPVVVASLWPLPDDASARLFKSFYRRLARGASVAEALAEAQRQAQRRGVPARAWAGLVVLGNGDLVPFPGGLPGTGLPPWMITVLVLAALAVLALFARRGGTLTPHPSPKGRGE